MVKSSPELIAAYAAACQMEEKKLNDPADRACFQAVDDAGISTIDPDEGLVRKGGQGSHPACHHHRAVDDAQGVITAVETTSGSIAENKKLLSLIEQHRVNTGCEVQTVAADHKYSTTDNFVACHQQGVATHQGDAKAKRGNVAGIFSKERIVHQAASDTYSRTSGQPLRRRRYIRRQRVWDYGADKVACAGCCLRSQPTRSKVARVIRRHEQAEELAICRAHAHSAAAKRDRQRRQYLVEGGSTDAAYNHGFERARRRRL